MKKSVLSLAVGLALVSLHSPVSATEKFTLSNKMARAVFEDVNVDLDKGAGESSTGRGMLDDVKNNFNALSGKPPKSPKPSGTKGRGELDSLVDIDKLSSEVLKGLELTQGDNLSADLFEQLSSDVLSMVDAEQLKDFPAGLIKQLRPKHFKAFDPNQFEKIEHKDIFRVIANTDSEHISAEDFYGLLPDGWSMDKDGLMTIPEGETFVLPPVTSDKGLFDGVVLPKDLPDLTKGLGIGGKGRPFLDGLNEALVKAGLPQFDISQDEDGVMHVEGVDEFKGMNLAFIPDMDNMTQAPKGTVSGLSQNKQGLSVLTTPSGQVLPIRPAPKSLDKVKKLMEGKNGWAKLGKYGDVSLLVPEHNGVPAKYRAGIFDPQVTAALGDIKPGVHFPDDLVGSEPAVVVYDDGTLQKMLPTVPAPEMFMEKAKEFEGVEDIQYKVDGTFDVVYKGQPITLKPTFATEAEELAQQSRSKVESSLILKAEGFLEYRYQQDEKVGVFRVNID